MYFLENLHFIGAWFRQSKCVVMMTKEGYTKIVNFITPWGRDSCAMAWPYMSYSENALFL